MEPTETGSEEGDDACFFVLVIILLYAVGFHTHPFSLLRYGHDNPCLGPKRRRFGRFRRYLFLVLTYAVFVKWLVSTRRWWGPREIKLKRIVCTPLVLTRGNGRKNQRLIAPPPCHQMITLIFLERETF